MATSDTEQQEKIQVTVISVAAAVVLTLLKLTVGLLTGSLGLISEAAHSGLDTIASIITFFSVRIAGRPPDAEHPYGHGRVENLSATIQGILLLVTAGAIIYEAIRRLVFETVAIETSIWTFAVMAASIGVDFWRSRMLAAAARKFNSRALEADALNFRADMFSSAVVILGLALAAYAEFTDGLDFLMKGDAAAALVVGVVIIVMSGRLALSAIDVLLDRAPTDLQERMTGAASLVPGVVASRPVRLRESGHRLLADVVVSVPRTASLAEAHEVAERIEAALRSVEPRAETVVHVEPAVPEAETAIEAIRAIALQMGVRSHHEQVYRVGDHLEASLHVEVEPQLTLGEAHALAHRLVEVLKEDNPQLRRVDTHIEVATPDPSQRREMGADHPEIVAVIQQAVAEIDADAHCREVRLYPSAASGWDATLHCDFPPSVPMGEIHRRTERIEQGLRQRAPELDQLVIHAEPRHGAGRSRPSLARAGRPRADDGVI